jgi:hypothetical protein
METGDMIDDIHITCKNRRSDGYNEEAVITALPYKVKEDPKRI